VKSLHAAHHGAQQSISAMPSAITLASKFELVTSTSINFSQNLLNNEPTRASIPVQPAERLNGAGPDFRGRERTQAQSDKPMERIG
jgi:hypothetical protein